MVEKNHDKVARRYLLLFKLDVKNLYERLSNRKHEYLMIFAMKRNRSHFDTIFKSRFESATFDDLANCDEDTIMALDQFYSYVEEIKWYLDHTQDMPNTIDDELTRMFHRLDQYYNTVMLYIDAELGVKSESQTADFEFDESSIATDESYVFSDDELTNFDQDFSGNNEPMNELPINESIDESIKDNN